MNRRQFLTSLSAAGTTLYMGHSWSDPTTPERKPNILIVIADDTTWMELGCYGGSNVATPHIDDLSAEGMLFNRAYTAMAMCVPCRHELYTGLYPLSNGSCWNHSTSRDDVKSICHYLGDLGYRVGLTGKCHAEPRQVFPFEIVDGFEPNCVHKESISRTEVKGITEFMTRNDAEPFCMVVGLVDAHMPWTTGNPEDYKSKDIVLPPTLPDIPAVREDYSKYLAEVSELDRNVGIVLKALEDAGKQEDTLVVFTSEQGAQWPGAKWTNWEEGLHTGLLVRWPGKVTPGTETDALVQYADVLPTLMEAAGGTAALDGTSFSDVLLGNNNRHREYAYAMHNNVPEGPPYPIRSVTDGRYRYIRNLTPDAEYIEKHMEGAIHKNGHIYWQKWKEAAKHPGRPQELYERFRKRPAEELYDTVNDPRCLQNLADAPEHAALKQLLSETLDAWMKSQNDPGAALDTEEAFYPNSLRKMNEDKRKAKK